MPIGLVRPRSAAAVVLSLVGVIVMTGCGGELLRQYEYEEEVFLSLDGSATIYVNASIPSLVALRGVDLNTNPRAMLDRAKIRALYTSPATRVAQVTSWRRSGRRFVHVRVDLDDIRHLSEVSPFGWSEYQLITNGELVGYRQKIGVSTNRPVGRVGWRGDELVAFRLHLPSKIQYHNAPPANLLRGNILVWEQTLADRLVGRPVDIEVRMESTSILYRTLWLFAMSFAAAVGALAIAIWWVMRRGRKPAAAT